MTLNFPNSPTQGDTYTAEGVTYQYDNGRWKLYGLDGTLYVAADGSVPMTGPLSINRTSPFVSLKIVDDVPGGAGDDLLQLISPTGSVYSAFDRCGNLIVNPGGGAGNWHHITIVAGDDATGGSINFRKPGDTNKTTDRWTISYRGDNQNNEIDLRYFNTRLYKFVPGGGIAGTDTGRCVLTKSSGDALYAPAASDERLKADVQDYASSALEKIGALRPVHFTWRIGEHFSVPEREGQQTGLIAQEVENIIPEAVIAGSDDYRGLDALTMIAMLVKAMQELVARVEQLESA